MHTIIMNTARWDPEKPGEDDLLCADGNIYYMGTYGRYDVLFYDSSQFASWRERIGEELFYDNQYSNIYLIGNGEKIMLRKAYSQGLVRDRDLFDLAKHFYQFHYYK